jgi:tRNA pseudouridine55 synthase
VKVGGRRAYDLARAGETPELKPRPVTVHRAELLWHEGDRAAFEIECSSGTYVRSLVTDLGDAYCDELERTAIGPFRLEDARPAGAEAAPAAADFVPLRDALAFMPELVLSPEEARAVCNGRRIVRDAGVTGHVRLTHEGQLLAIGESVVGEAEESQAGQVRPVVVFAPA